MVLSNKKLKQKVRSLVAESLTATESKKACKVASDEDANHQLQNLKELLRSKSQKPRTKRRKKLPLSEDSKPVEGSEETQKENGDNVVSISLNKKEKNKKRKREGDGADESVEKQQQKKANKKKKGKKKDKKKKEKEKEKDEKEGKKNEKGIEAADGNSNENREDPVKIDESEENAKKVYVGGIPYYSTEDDIRSFFEGCGTVTEVDCMRFPESGKFRGIAMLTFKTEAAAKRALALDGADMGGLYLKVQPYKANRLQKSDFAPEIVDGYNRVYVGNLSWDITEDELRKFFSDCNISIIRFGTDKTTGDFKGYAHVDFSDDVSLAIALKLDQEVVCGRPARIRCAVPRKAGKTELTELSSTSTGKKAGEPDLSSTTSGKKAGGNDLRPTPTGEKAGGNDMSSASTGNKTEIGTSGKKSKAKRRTCYVCGTPGHLSSSCPSKKTVEVNESGGNS